MAGVDSGSRSESSHRNLELCIELRSSLNRLISQTTLRRATPCKSRHYSWPYSIYLHLHQHHTILRHVSTSRPPPSPNPQGTIPPSLAAGSCEIRPCATINALFHLPTQHHTSLILGIHDPQASAPSWPSQRKGEEHQAEGVEPSYLLHHNHVAHRLYVYPDDCAEKRLLRLHEAFGR